MVKKLLQNVLIKPAGPDCNLHCDYCFYLKKAELFANPKKHRMSLAILREIVRQVMEQGPANVSFSWQGGEPTLMGLPFFQKAVEYQQRFGRNQVVGNGLQTNGILINQNWADFLKRYKFMVGLSFDGPKHIHDKHRKTSSGCGSWLQVSKTARLLLDAGVLVNAVTVLNDYSVNFPEEIYGFHKESGFDHMQFIPCIEPDPTDPARPAQYSVPPQKYGEFLCALFDLWEADFKNGLPTISIRYFDSLLYLYLGREAAQCDLKKQCGDYLVIEHNGEVYSCDFFVEPAWRLGNVNDSNLLDLLNSIKQTQFGRQKARLSTKCQACGWLDLCHGGCPKDRQHNPLDRSTSAFCEAQQMFFNYADTRMRTIAEKIKAGNRPDNSRQKQNGRAAGDKIGRNMPCPCGSGKKYKRCCGVISK